MILNLRGPGGSGKTWLVRELLRRYNNFPINGPDSRNKMKLVGHFIPQFDIVLVGPYNEGRSAAGCDAIQPFDRVEPLVRSFSTHHNALFEGRITSSVIGRWLRLAEEAPSQFFWLWIDTPPEKCVENILSRNGGKPIKEHHIYSEYKRSASHYQKLLGIPEMSPQTFRIHHEQAWEDFSEALRTIGFAVYKD